MLYGLNFHSVETSLPASNGQKLSSGTISCTGYNYPALWQTAGYTRTNVENALFTMQNDFEAAFPHTQLLAGLNPTGFPRSIRTAVSSPNKLRICRFPPT